MVSAADTSLQLFRNMTPTTLNCLPLQRVTWQFSNSLLSPCFGYILRGLHPPCTAWLAYPTALSSQSFLTPPTSHPQHQVPRAKKTLLSTAPILCTQLPHEVSRNMPSPGHACAISDHFPRITAILPFSCSDSSLVYALPRIHTP